MLLLSVSYALWLPLIGQFLFVSDPLIVSDAVLPLAGARERPPYAAQIFTDGFSGHFLITFLPLDNRRSRKWYVEDIKRIAIENNVPKEKILFVQGRATTTFEEAENVREFILNKGWTSLIVLTSDYHSRRSKFIFNRVFQNSDIDISIQIAASGYQPERWWQTPEGRRLTFSEYAKLFAFFIGVK